jgi:hypothetical protein
MSFSAKIEPVIRQSLIVGKQSYGSPDHSSVPWEHHGRTCLHEATLAPVFEDGVRSVGTTVVDGTPYELLGNSTDADIESQRPSAEIVAWVLECDCRQWDGSVFAVAQTRTKRHRGLLHE